MTRKKILNHLWGLGFYDLTEIYKATNQVIMRIGKTEFATHITAFSSGNLEDWENWYHHFKSIKKN